MREDDNETKEKRGVVRVTVTKQPYVFIMKSNKCSMHVTDFNFGLTMLGWDVGYKE